MKLTAYLLIIYICFLTVQPSVNVMCSAFAQPQMENCCKHSSCCKSEKASCQQKHNKQAPDNCCPKGICNLFKQCGCCSCVTISKLTLQLIAKIITSNILIPILTDTHSDYCADCFHPPELA